MEERYHVICHIASTTHPPNVGPMLGRRRRLWANIGPTWVDVSCLLYHVPWMALCRESYSQEFEHSLHVSSDSQMVPSL